MGHHIGLFICIIFNFAVADLTSHHLQLTALISDEQGKAKFQCWEIATPFSGYPTVGDAISGLANVANVSYVVLPPRSNEGLHKPPYPMFFVLLSGLAHVTLPDSDDDLWIKEGVNGLMIAADVVGEGHYTEYPADKPSVALQIPFDDGNMPAHRIVSNATCEATTDLSMQEQARVVSQEPLR